MREEIIFPWINRTVPVTVDEGEESSPALDTISSWNEKLRVKIERACWADYLDLVNSIEAEPPDVPVITEPEQIWEHIELVSVRPAGSNYVVVYAVPAWNETLQHEWVIQAPDRLIYVGQFLRYRVDESTEPPSGYFRTGEDENRALNHEAIIAELNHIPRQWAAQKT